MAKKEPIQNPMYDCGYAREVNPRCRQFGVLGFDDRPEAQIGGQLIHKNDTDESKGKDAHGG